MSNYSDPKAWDELYEDLGGNEVPWIKSKFIEEHLDFFKKFENKECLCVADGNGDNGIKLAKLGINVTATEISTKAIKKAIEQAEELKLTNYKVVETGTLDFDFQKKFDLIVGIKIQFTVEYSKLHEQMKKLLKKNGCIAISGFHTEHFKLKERGPPLVELLYSTEDLKNDFENFKFIETKDYIQEFQYETGNRKQYLVSFIAEKLE
eukprot:gene6527-10535_t